MPAWMTAGPDGLILEWIKLLAVAGGGAAGAVSRMLCGSWAARFAGSTFPWGTLLVNVLGCFLVGIVYVVLVERLRADPLWADVLIVGFLGGFTTFSAFSLATLTLFQQGEALQGTAYLFGTLGLCLISTFAGLVLARSL